MWKCPGSTETATAWTKFDHHRQTTQREQQPQNNSHSFPYSTCPRTQSPGVYMAVLDVHYYRGTAVKTINLRHRCDNHHHITKPKYSIRAKLRPQSPWHPSSLSPSHVTLTVGLMVELTKSFSTTSVLIEKRSSRQESASTAPISTTVTTAPCVVPR